MSHYIIEVEEVAVITSRRTGRLVVKADSEADARWSIDVYGVDDDETTWGEWKDDNLQPPQVISITAVKEKK